MIDEAFSARQPRNHETNRTLHKHANGMALHHVYSLNITQMTTPSTDGQNRNNALPQDLHFIWGRGKASAHYHDARRCVERQNNEFLQAHLFADGKQTVGYLLPFHRFHQLVA